MAVDMEACLRERHVLMRKLKELEKEAYRLAGMAFSLYTAADIANVLYTHLKLPIPQGRNKGKLHPSTDKHSLDQLRYLLCYMLSLFFVFFLRRNDNFNKTQTSRRTWIKALHAHQNCPPKKL